MIIIYAIINLLSAEEIFTEGMSAYFSGSSNVHISISNMRNKTRLTKLYLFTPNIFTSNISSDKDFNNEL